MGYGDIHIWIASFLYKRSQQEERTSTNGLPHFSRQKLASDRRPHQAKYHWLAEYPKVRYWGPLLFFLFINDLLESVSSSTRLFADEYVVHRVIRSEQDCHQLYIYGATGFLGKKMGNGISPGQEQCCLSPGQDRLSSSSTSYRVRNYKWLTAPNTWV